MQTEDQVPQTPQPPVPGGTRWIKITSPHPGQVIKVKKSNDLSVFYMQERPGQSQGRVNGTHRSDRHNFLRDYEPYSKRDWTAAQKLMATLDQTVALPEAAADEPIAIEAPTNGQVTAMPADDSPPPGEEQEVSEITITQVVEEPVEEPVDEPAKRRIRVEEFSPSEQVEIIELWRNGESVPDIATTYNTLPPAIYGILKSSSDVADEYWLQRIVDHLAKHGPVPAYQISQWMHLKRERVAELCTSDAARLVLHYTVETNDPSKPWIKTPMVSLLPKPSVEKPAEIPTAVGITAPTPEEEPVTTATNNTTEVPMPETPADRPLRQWRVMIRTTVEDKVSATDIATAIETAKAKYASRPAEVVGVMEE